MGEKDLPPSEKKLRKSREEGEDPQSGEIYDICDYISIIPIIWISIPSLFSFIMPLLRFDYIRWGAGGEVIGSQHDLMIAIQQIARYAAYLCFGALFLAGTVGYVVNRRRAPNAVMPKLSYNPMSKLMGMFEPKELIGTLRLWLCAVLSMVFVIILVKRQLNGAVSGVFATANSDLSIAISMFSPILPIVFVFKTLAAIIDYVLKYIDYINKSKMDHEEVKQENKEDNGDPLIKSKRKEIAMGGVTISISKSNN